MKQALIFSLKVWLTAAFVTPLIVIFLLYLAKLFHLHFASSAAKTEDSMLYICLYLSFLMLIGTLIPWLLAQIFLNLIVQSRLSIGMVKLIIGMIVILPFGLLLVIGSSGKHTGIPMAWVGFIAVAIASALSLWFYKLNLTRPSNPGR